MKKSKPTSPPSHHLNQYTTPRNPMSKDLLSGQSSLKNPTSSLHICIDLSFSSDFPSFCGADFNMDPISCGSMSSMPLPLLSLPVHPTTSRPLTLVSPTLLLSSVFFSGPSHLHIL